jgi:transcriptional regulator with XRE-family HTH domain
LWASIFPYQGLPANFLHHSCITAPSLVHAVSGFTECALGSTPHPSTTTKVNEMITQRMTTPLCPCFGRELRRLRDEADMSLEKLAELTGCAVEVVDEVERGRRAVLPEWVAAADRAMGPGGMLRIEAAECLSYHAGLVCDPFEQTPHDGASPIHLPAGFAGSAT